MFAKIKKTWFIYFTRTKHKHRIKVSSLDSEYLHVLHLVLIQFCNKQETFGTELKDKLLVFTRTYTFKLNQISYIHVVGDETKIKVVLAI